MTDNVFYRSITSNSHQAYSLSPYNTTFRVELRPHEIIDSDIKISAFVRATIVGNSNVAGDGEFVETRGLCLANYPLHRCMKSLEIRINNNISIKSNPSEYLQALLRLQSNKTIARFNELSPCQNDPYNTIGMLQVSGGLQLDANYDFSNGEAINNYHAANSPYASIQNIQTQSRVMFNPISVDTIPLDNGTSPQELTVEYELTETLLSPVLFNLIYNRGHEIKNIHTLDITIEWANLNALFTYGEALTFDLNNDLLTDFTVDGFSSNSAKLFLSSRILETPVIEPFKLEYFEIDTYKYQLQKCNSIYGDISTTHKDRETLRTGNIQMSQIPHKVIIFAKRRGIISSRSEADAFLAITSLKLDNSDVSGLFAECTPQQLYDISRSCGLNMTYSEFSLNVGSVICLDLSRGYIPKSKAGKSSDYFMDFEISFRNTQYLRKIHYYLTPVDDPILTPEQATITQWDLYILALQHRTLTISENGDTHKE